MTRLSTVATIAMRVKNTSGWVDIHPHIPGYRYSDMSRSRPKPELSGVTRHDMLDVSDTSLAVTVDDDDTTAAIFWVRSGEEFDVRIRVAGDGTGKPEVTFSGPAQIDVLAPQGGIIQYQVRVTASRTVTSTTQ